MVPTWAHHHHWAGLGWAGLVLTLLCGAKLFCSYSAKHCAALCAVDETMTGMQKKLVTNSVYKRNLFQRLITVTAACCWSVLLYSLVRRTWRILVTQKTLFHMHVRCLY